jgi:hypothetical protein
MSKLSITDFSSPGECFGYCRANPGHTIEIPPGEFEVGGFSMPHYTDLVGHGHRSILRMSDKPLLIPNSQGALHSNYAVKADGIAFSLDNARSCEFNRIKILEAGEAAFVFSGASYYNWLRECWFDKIGVGVSVRGLCNDNHLIGCRIHATEAWVRFDLVAHAWSFISNSFEGVPDKGCGSIFLKGEDHLFLGGRYENGKGNHWNPATFVLDSTVRRLKVIGGRRSYGFSVIDDGVDNRFDL